MYRKGMPVLFGRQNKNAGAARRDYDGQAHPELVLITDEMMLKGARVPRRGGTVRQFSVMIGGAIRIVTSGDTVDRSIYEALLAKGAVKPIEDDQAPVGSDED